VPDGWQIDAYSHNEADYVLSAGNGRSQRMVASASGATLVACYGCGMAVLVGRVTLYLLDSNGPGQ